MFICLTHGVAERDQVPGDLNLYNIKCARVMELVDILDLKSGGQKPCGFDSRLAHQNWYKIGRSARKRRFFFGRAERKPDIFLGGMSYRARQEPRCFV